MEYISEMIKSPYAGIMIIAIGMLISIFAGFSRNIKVNISMTIIKALSYMACFYLYVRNFLIFGPLSDFLINLGLPEIILSGVIVFCGLNLLFFISINRLSGNNYMRIIILLSFSLISVLFLVMADNVVLILISLIISVLSIFNLLASLETEDTLTREYLGRFGMRAAIPTALMFFGFSVLEGIGSVKDLSAYTNIGNTGDPLLNISAFVFNGAVYLYFFPYPFQGTYLRLTRKMKASSVPVLWFLYIPAGLVLLMKFDLFFSIFCKRESIYGFVALVVLAFLNLLGAGLGSLKAVSIKRIISMFLLFQLGTVLLIKSIGISTDTVYNIVQYDLVILIITLITFLPVTILALVIEKDSKADRISGAGGLIRRYPYIGICFVVLLIWWLAADIYIFFLQGPVQEAGLLGQGIEGIIFFAGYIVALLLMAANVLKILIIFFKKPSMTDSLKRNDLPRVFYIYLSFFVLLALSSLILMIIGKVDIGQDNINIWGNTFYIFSNGN